jgi:BirA family transcriptional regulator, biotin operon repressor / biotin---[acetyl-CoA-carboxylase] ligase
MRIFSSTLGLSSEAILHNCTRRMVSAMWHGEWDVRWLHEVDSTNTYVRELARQGAKDGLVVAADHQTAGRGRLDRRWESPPGTNLLASVLVRPDCGPDEVHLCTAAVALAGADACRDEAGTEVLLKWPNDLLAQGSKVGGVLAEADFVARALAGVVVGIGINVAWPGPPEAAGTNLDAWRSGGPPVDRRALLDRLLERLAPRRALLDHAAGRRTLADETRARCATVGQSVRVIVPGGEFTGVASAIDDAGHLVVDTEAGTRLVSAGDVVHLRER